jgi:acyl-homoserine lactone acylase PvdQ
MPMALDPPAGRIVSANHRVPPPGYPHHLGHIWMAGWRAAAIHDALDAQPAQTLEASRLLQLDFRCIPGERLRDRYAALAPAERAAIAGASALSAAALGALEGWDGRMEAASAGASGPGPSGRLSALSVSHSKSVLYGVFVWARGALNRQKCWFPARAVYELVAEALGGLLLAHLLATAGLNTEGADAAAALQLYKGKGMHPTLAPRSELRSGLRGRVLAAVEDPASCGATRAQVVGWLGAALAGAAAWLAEKLGAEAAGWRWGRLHQIHINHQLQGSLGAFLNVPPFEYGGNSDTVAQVSIADIPFGDVVPSPQSPGTASYRVIYTPAAWDNCQNVLPVGVSEKWGSEHFADQTPLWAEGRLKPMWWSRAKVEEHTAVWTEVVPSSSFARM